MGREGTTNLEDLLAVGTTGFTEFARGEEDRAEETGTELGLIGEPVVTKEGGEGQLELIPHLTRFAMKHAFQTDLLLLSLMGR